MAKSYIYGQAAMSLSDLVDDFCLQQGNNREAYYPRFLVMAKWAWKKLFRESIWEIKQVVLDVKHHKDNQTIQVPLDCDRIVGIYVVDHAGKLQPLTKNPDYNTAQIRCQSNTCTCKNCHGNGTLCGALDNVTMTTETVYIHDTAYTLTTYIRYGSYGSLLKEQIIPTWDSNSSTVVMQTVVSNICKLETDDKGCIKATTPNINALISHIGWDGSDYGWNGYWSSHRIIPEIFNYWGEWKENAADPSIIHIFRHRTHQQYKHSDANINRVILAYQTNGETPDAEIMVPEYAVEAVQMGILYRQRKFNPKDGDRDGEGLRAWNRSKRDVERYLNPVRMEDIAKIQSNLRRW